MLKLDRLELQNWCSTVGTRNIDFTEGFNVINGRNGKGKTSIVDAISILLINKYEGSFENYINDSCTEASIRLLFRIDNDSYESSLKLVKRKSTSSERVLKKNDDVIATGEDCATKLEALLPSFLTDYSLFYKQGGTNKVTECSDSDRRNLLTQLISLDYTEKVKKMLTPEIEKLENSIKTLETDLYAIGQKTYPMLEKKPVGEPHPQSQIDALKNQVKIWENNNQNIQKKLQLETEIISATKDLENTKTTYDVDKLNATRESNIQNLKTVADQKLANIENLKKDAKDKSKATMEKYLADSNNFRNSLNNIQIKEIPDFDYTLVTKASNLVTNINTQIGIAQKNYEVLKTGICPTCGGKCEHKAEDILKEIEDLNSQLTSAQFEEQKANKAKAEHDLEVSQNEKAKLEHTTLTDSIRLTESQIEAEKVNIVNTLKGFKDSEESIKEMLEKDIANVNNSTDASINSSKEIISQKEMYLNKLQSDLNSLVIENVPDCRAELQQLENENLEIERIVAYNKGVDEQNTLIEQQKKLDAESKEKWEKDLTNLKMVLADYNLSVEILSKTYPTWRLERDLEYIKEQTNVFVEDIYKPLNVRFSANKNSLKMVYGNGERDLPVKRLSGAEKQIVNLGVENIFNQEQNLSCLILDESDSAMDVENKEAFFSVLLGLQEHYEQVIVITHSTEMKQKLQAEGANIILL